MDPQGKERTKDANQADICVFPLIWMAGAVYLSEYQRAFQTKERSHLKFYFYNNWRFRLNCKTKKSKELSRWF